VFEPKLVHPGKPGSKLVRHAEGPPCEKPGVSPDPGLPGFPSNCGSFGLVTRPGAALLMFGSRDVTIDFAGRRPFRRHTFRARPPRSR